MTVEGLVADWLRDPETARRLEATRARVGLVGPDGEPLEWVWEELDYWLALVRG